MHPARAVRSPGARPGHRASHDRAGGSIRSHSNRRLHRPISLPPRWRETDKMVGWSFAVSLTHNSWSPATSSPNGVASASTSTSGLTAVIGAGGGPCCRRASDSTLVLAGGETMGATARIRADRRRRCRPVIGRRAAHRPVVGASGGERSEHTRKRWRAGNGFPEPVNRYGRVWVWRWGDVERWARNARRRPGRRSRSPAD